MKRLLVGGMCAALLLVCPSRGFPQEAKKKPVTNEELLSILDITIWRVPLPKDENLIWTFELVDAKPRTERKWPDVKAFYGSGEAMFALRSIPEKGEFWYDFTLKQREGFSKGTTRISLCGEHPPPDCDESSVMTPYDPPKCIDDGKTFLLADLAPMLEPEKVKKQLILRPAKSRID